MPDTIVHRRGRDGSVKSLPIRFTGKQQNFVLQTERIEHRMSANIAPRLLDLLEIAAAVFCADSSFSRGSKDQPREGRTWRRDLSFRFAVRDLDFWEHPDIARSLRETIEFMTGDHVDCEFLRSDQPPQIQSYMRFAENAEIAYQIDDVILFSGGVDSLAGILETLQKTDRRVALVTHRSAQKTVRQQDRLFKELSLQFGDRILWVPVQVHRRGLRRSESTQRSRSLLFAGLGCVVARMLNANRLQFFENGFVSQNLPLARPIVGTLATRTTHPCTLMHLEALLSQVVGAPFDVSNEFQWMTKSEVVKVLVDHGQSRLLPFTVSCNHTFRRKSAVRHCGSCSQCLDRRFAVLANGLGHLDPSDDYATDVLLGARDQDDDRTLAIEWVRHARRLAQMGPEEFFNMFSSELLKIATPFPDRRKAIASCHELHRRHGQSVNEVLDMFTDREIGDAPEDSLAAIFACRQDAPVPQLPPTLTRIEDAPVRQASSHSTSALLEIARQDSNNINIYGLQDFFGVKARLLSCLFDCRLEDRKAGRRVSEFKTLFARELGDELGVSEDYARQEVARIRRELRESWRAIHDSEPPTNALIETVGKKGYRLAPTINLVESDQH